MILASSGRWPVFYVTIAGLQLSSITRLAVIIFLAHVYPVKQSYNAISVLLLPCCQSRRFLVRIDKTACSKQKPKPLEFIAHAYNSFFNEVKHLFNLLDLKGPSNARRDWVCRRSKHMVLNIVTPR